MPELERPENERASMKADVRRWTTMQEAIAVAAVTACQSKAAYELMAPYLMDAIQHDPTYGPDAQPSNRIRTANCIRALELRIVSKIIGDPERDLHVSMGFPSAFRRPFGQLTWGERAKIIRPWARRVAEGKSYIEFGPLMQMLGRVSVSFKERLRVEFYLGELASNPRLQDSEIVPSLPPVWKDNWQQVLMVAIASDNWWEEASEIAYSKEFANQRRRDCYRQLYGLLWRVKT